MGNEKLQKADNEPSNQTTSALRNESPFFGNDKAAFFKPADQQQSKLYKDQSSISSRAEIFFKTGDSSLDPSDKQVLTALARDLNILMLKYKAEIHIEGYADYRGSEKDNMALANFRSAIVASFLKDVLSKNSTNFSISTNSIGEQKGNKELASQRRASVYVSFPGKPLPKKPEPKPEKVKLEDIPLPGGIKPTPTELEETDTERVVKKSAVAIGKGGLSLTNSLLGGSALLSGGIIVLQVGFMVEMLKLLGQDPNKIYAATVGTVYGQVVAAYNASLAYNRAKKDNTKSPSEMIHHTNVKKNFMPRAVSRKETFNKYFNRAYKDFMAKASYAFKHEEGKLPTSHPTLAHRRKAAKQLQDGANAVAMSNIVRKNPSSILQKSCAANVQVALAAKHFVYYDSVKNVAYTYPFD
ncbi:MAG: OmpA family protein [Bacteroidota bacterium]